MTNIISFLLMVIATFGIYPKYGYIVELEPLPEDMYEVTVEDANGELWAFDTDTDDYAVGDGVSLIMYDSGTEIIYDDVILSARYSGFWRD